MDFYQWIKWTIIKRKMAATIPLLPATLSLSLYFNLLKSLFSIRCHRKVICTTSKYLLRCKISQKRGRERERKDSKLFSFSVFVSSMPFPASSTAADAAGLVLFHLWFHVGFSFCISITFQMFNVLWQKFCIVDDIITKKKKRKKSKKI